MSSRWTAGYERSGSTISVPACSPTHRITRKATCCFGASARGVVSSFAVKTGVMNDSGHATPKARAEDSVIPNASR